MEQEFLWLIHTFGEEKIRNRKVLLPEPADFPLQNADKFTAAEDALKIVAAQMEVKRDDILLEFYQQNEKVGGDDLGNDVIKLKTPADERSSGGVYKGKWKDGKYHLGLNVVTVEQPEKTIAVLAHEISHIKLLGERRRFDDNEPLTDLTTVIFGLGIFNANESFHIQQSFGWSTAGYLSQMEWGYGLALFALVRNETSPAWADYLNPTVKADFEQGIKFIEANKNRLFNQTGQGPINFESEYQKVYHQQHMGRNEKCWCGSGKKFKHCHGREL